MCSAQPRIEKVLWRESNVKIVAKPTTHILVVKHIPTCNNLKNVALEGNLTVDENFVNWCLKVYNRYIDKQIQQFCPTIANPAGFVEDILLKNDNEPLSVWFFVSTLRLLSEKVAATVNGTDDKLQKYLTAENWNSFKDQKGKEAEHQTKIQKRFGELMTKTYDDEKDFTKMKAEDIKMNLQQLTTVAVSDMPDNSIKLIYLLNKYKKGIIDHEFEYLFPGIIAQMCPDCPIDFGLIHSVSCARSQSLWLMELKIDQLSPMKKVLKADPFVSITKKDDQFCVEKYIGPDYIIMDLELNCTEILDSVPPNVHSIQGDTISGVCDNSNLEKYEQLKCYKKMPEKFRIQTKSDNKRKFLLCHAGKIDFDSVREDCDGEVKETTKYKVWIDRKDVHFTIESAELFTSVDLSKFRLKIISKN